MAEDKAVRVKKERKEKSGKEKKVKKEKKEKKAEKVEKVLVVQQQDEEEEEKVQEIEEDVVMADGDEKIAAEEDETAVEEKDNGDDDDVEEEKEATTSLKKAEKKDKRDKKEKSKKSKKEKDSSPASSDDAEEEKEAASNSDSFGDEASKAPSPSSKKRKRPILPEDILEIDVNLPEPPSKKALRKLKKAGIDPSTLVAPAPAPTSTPGIGATQHRSKHGVWIGNMSFSTTEAQLREFLLAPPTTTNKNDADPDPIDPEELEITRVNLPTKVSVNPLTRKSEVRNRGFAYVDFKNQKAVRWMVENKSEKLLVGRKVLIKDANDYSGRPAPVETPAATKTVTVTTSDGKVVTTTVPASSAAPGTANPPSRILFLGNLPFDTTDEEIQSHFSFAGTIKKVRLGRFEDSGKCKGFGFVDFEEIDEVTRAIKGLSPEDELAEKAGGKGGVKLEGKEEFLEERARRKRRGERLYFKGRKLRMEYGEDAEVRYKKRWGGKKEEREPGAGKEGEEGAQTQRPKRTERRVDARTIPPGEALARAMASRMTGAIVEAKGKKVTFD